MTNTSGIKPESTRDIHYYRQRYKNRVFARLVSFISEESERTGMTKKDIAAKLTRDPAQITRWLSNPSNLTLDTISDLLLAFGAEAEPPDIVKFSDKPTPNYVHPLVTLATNAPIDQPRGITELKRSITSSATSANVKELHVAQN